VQQGQPTDDPILLALTDAQRRYTIPAGLLDDLALGTAMDVVDPALRNQSAPLPCTLRRSRAAHRSIQTFEDLKLYCYRVASVVGLVCIHIFGYRDPAAEPLAEQCGLAFQLTNIIRDVKEDAAMGRVYLPEEDLAKFGLSAAELLSKPDAARFRPCSRSKPIAPAKATRPATN
jgi:15-cis-phytoene synthase